jgi:hypothetical protein
MLANAEERMQSNNKERGVWCATKVVTWKLLLPQAREKASDRANDEADRCV